MRCEIYFTHKAGNDPEEYEDAAGGDSLAARFAIADGATQSTFSASWAEILVRGYIEKPIDAEGWEGWLPPLQARWVSQFSGVYLPYYAEQKMRETGAYAAFLGLSIEFSSSADRHHGHWHAVAVGDSCVFHIRHGRLLHRFPIQEASEFGSSPWLIGSWDSATRFMHEPIVARKTAEWRTGDELWMMTDAFSRWFLVTQECGNADASACAAVSALLSQQPNANMFGAWVSTCRANGEMQNDDVTLLAIQL